MNINKSIQSAFEHYKAGNLQQAEQTCRKILIKKPKNTDALHLLGLISFTYGDYDSAIEHIKKALHFNPTNPDALCNLGNSLKAKGQLDEAIAHFQKALQINPNFVQAYNNLGTALRDKGQPDESITYYQKSLQLNPGFADAYYNLGNVLRDKGQLDEAITCYQKALQLDPGAADAYYSLGNAHRAKGQFDEAITCYQKALQLDPEQANSHNNLGNILRERGQLGEAITHFQKALLLNPNFEEAYNNLGNSFLAKGQLNKAITHFQKALQINSNNSNYFSNILFSMNYNYQYDAQTIFAEHVKFAKQFSEILSPNITPLTNESDPARKLRIGYVSPDFRKHSVAFFIEPVISAHNREHFEVYCYLDVFSYDRVTKRIQGHADQWRNISGVPDKEAAELILEDKIDILIDLTGHTANNRMLLFARKPAPIQATWIGYPATTGLKTMDYKIVDAYTDPPGMTEQFYTEKLLRLPESFLCYLPDRESPEVKPLPALSAGHITFGSFNHFPKVSPEAFAVWVKLLREIPESRLILKAMSFADSSTCQHAMEKFIGEGIAEERVELLARVPSMRGHLDMYNRIDIGLDTFPYNGTTTTCEALWMGVPVVTLHGGTYASRVGTSLLSNVGLPDLVSKTQEEYANVAVKLANDLNRLQSLRGQLRNMMKQSPLTDAERFTGNLEACYRRIWEDWCQA